MNDKHNGAIEDTYNFEIKYAYSKPVAIDISIDFGGPVMPFPEALQLGNSLIQKQQSPDSVSRGLAIIEAVKPYLTCRR